MDAESRTVITKVQELVRIKYKGDYAAAFQAYDLDKSGKLGPKDLRKLLEDCNIGNWLTRGKWVAGIIAALDANGDGAVSIPELTLAMMKTML